MNTLEKAGSRCQLFPLFAGFPLVGRVWLVFFDLVPLVGRRWFGWRVAQPGVRVGGLVMAFLAAAAHGLAEDNAAATGTVAKSGVATGEAAKQPESAPSLSEAAKIANSRRNPNRALAPPAKPLTPQELKAREEARKRGDYTFDDLKFDIEKDQAFEEKMLTKEIRALHQKKMRIRGYMLPTSVFQTKGIKQFVLVRDNQECCFGPGAAIYDCIMIEMAPDKTTEFNLRPIAVSGTFVIDTESFQYPDGGHYAIFKMIATEAK
jgi:hypothetical protein